MAVTKDYMYWRGDVPFSVAPVTEADEFLICMMGMFDLRHVVPEDGTYISMRRALELYLANGGDLSLGALTSDTVAPSVLSIQKSERFADVMLSGYRLHVSPAENEQFSALTVRLPGGKHYITFRGTDDTIVGWKENFLLTVQTEVPAQHDAADYLRWAAETYPGQLVVAGHSKGGNLAVYASSVAEEEVQSRIEKILNLDGPGFMPEFLENPGYRRIRGKIRTVVPQHTMVSSLLFRDSEIAVVKSDAQFLSAHNGFTWEVDGRGGFVRMGDRSPASKAFDQAMKTVLESMSPQERTEFIEQMFGTLAAGGAVTITEVTDRKVWEVMRTMLSLVKEPEVRKMALDSLEEVTRDYLTEKGKSVSLLKLPGLFRRRDKTEDGPEPAEEDTEETGWYE